MSKKIMMLVSFLVTCCVTILAIVVIMFVSYLDPSKEKADGVHTEAATIEPEIETEEEAFKSQGIDVYKDEYGIHDVYFMNKTKVYNGSSGPIDVEITNVQLERFYPDEGLGEVYAEGASEVSVVSLNLKVTNTSNDDSFFVVKSVRGRADTGETSKIDTLLSDTFNNTYAPNSTQEGTIYFMYEGNPNNIATISMSFNGAENTSSSKIGDELTLKINLY